MKILYSDTKVQKACTERKAAGKLFGGNKQLAVSLLSRINAIENADTLMDIIKMPNYHFHKLLNMKRKDYKGYYAIDVKSRKDPWRIILQPLDENENPYPESESIDQIAGAIKIVEITEISKHYE